MTLDNCGKCGREACADPRRADTVFEIGIALGFVLGLALLIAYAVTAAR